VCAVPFSTLVQPEGNRSATKTTEILETLGVRAETNRALVIGALAAKIGRPVPRSAILKTVYGADDAEAAKKLHFVLMECAEKSIASAGRRLSSSRTRKTAKPAIRSTLETNCSFIQLSGLFGGSYFLSLPGRKRVSRDATPTLAQYLASKCRELSA
jgi:hypothetical protein